MARASLDATSFVLGVKSAHHRCKLKNLVYRGRRLDKEEEDADGVPD